VVFKLSPGGTETVLHSFTGSDGDLPAGGLIADSSGNLYGTTYFGGTCSGGVVFKLSPGGTETVLQSSCDNPYASLIADSIGNLYGTTEHGGAGCELPLPVKTTCGTVFKLSPGGTETGLHTFMGSPGDGAIPAGGLIADSSGDLYGTTRYGGPSGGRSMGACCGVVFKLAGTGFTTAVPFLAFNATLDIAFGAAPNQDSFNLHSQFTLSSTAPGLHPHRDPVTLSVGTFSITIPPHSFKEQPDGSFFFTGVVNGVSLKARITPTATLQYAFHAKVTGASLTGTTNPVYVTLIISGDSGATSVAATISGAASVEAGISR
jgi:uncharacterized repeat protein (TIGR03803 family)